MSKRDLYGYLAILLAILTSLGLGWYMLYAPHYLRIAVAPAESGMTRFLTALSGTFESQRASVRLQVLPLASSAEVASAIANDRADLAVVRSDRPLPASTIAVAAFQEIIVVTLVRPDAGIANFYDLGGKRITIVGPESANMELFQSLGRLHRISIDNTRIIAVKYAAEAAELFEENKTDAVFMAAPRGSPAVVRLYDLVAEALEKAPVFVPLSEMKSITSLNPGFTRSEISAGEIKASPRIPEKTVRTITFPALIVARTKTRNSAIMEFTRSLFTHRLALAGQYPAATRLVALPTKRDAPFPLHPGAAIYYDASEESFLDKYSDLMWLALFGFSGIASIFVWFFRLAIPKTRRVLSAERDSIVDLIKSARQARSAEELARIQRQADDIVFAISDQLYSGLIEAERQPSFDLLLGRLDGAIETRRAELRPAQA